ncbi:MAG: aldolase catalytic domain-containing protein [Bacteroidales bacterium]|jgi:4-hydroxy 2-oxovalerate aldolase|nr:aldolase catalytic domain-containing protein [Bacteroidales bacterium]
MIKLLDCTLRDGGYYNSWDFSAELVSNYLNAMDALGVAFVEIGFRSLRNNGFKGGYAFSSDSFLSNLPIPKGIENKLGVMLNGSELIEHELGLEFVLSQLFKDADKSPVYLVRVACHVHQFEQCLPAATWLKDKGYLVGFNLMQVADCDDSEITKIANKANQYPIDVLYFADSMGSMNPEQTSQIVGAFKSVWQGDLGIHTHDNMGNALANSLQGIQDGVAWVDSTVTGMGRGPGNVQTEYLAIELQSRNQLQGNLTPLFETIRTHFQPLQNQYGWGSNPYYYLAGQYGIHPSYIQEMLGDSRYNDEDILAVIQHLKSEGGKRFNFSTLEAARHFFSGELKGSWRPANDIRDRTVLILGAGPSVKIHRQAVEAYIKQYQPYVIALNTQKNIDEALIDIRAACHPVRLLADCHEHARLPQPLATPFHMLPEDVKAELESQKILDFGLTIYPENFVFDDAYCTLPNSLVIAYALAIATSGQADSIYLAGFDGYGADDPRRKETDEVFQLYQKQSAALALSSITPTLYDVTTISVYALLK